jgi:hypothetical protein
MGTGIHGLFHGRHQVFPVDALLRDDGGRVDCRLIFRVVSGNDVVKIYLLLLGK